MTGLIIAVVGLSIVLAIRSGFDNVVEALEKILDFLKEDDQ